MKLTHGSRNTASGRPSAIRSEFCGALSAAIVTLPMAIGYGVTAFAILGADFRPQAALIGLNAAIFGGFCAALFGGTPAQISGPKAPLTLILTSVVIGLSASPDLPLDLAQRELAIVGLAAMCVMIGGLAQVLFGACGIGNVVKYVPHPVVAGFMNGIALLLIWKQLPPLLGLQRGAGLTELLAGHAAADPASVLIGVATLTAALLSGRCLKRLPPLLAGLLVGTGVYLALGLRPEVAHRIAVVGTLHATLPAPIAFTALFRHLASAVPISVLSNVVVYGIVLGMVGSMESLISSVAIDNLSGRRHDSNRELVGQGIGNIVASLFGALFSAGSIPRSATNYLSGGRGRLSGVLCSLLILTIFLTMAPLLGRIPLAVFAGIIMAVGLNLFDRSTLRLMRSLGNSLASRKDVAVNLLVNLSVAVITVSVNLVTAVIIGMAISMAYFVVKMSISIVRRQYAGNNVHSRRVRNFGQLQYLRQNGRQIRVVELHGPVFFGSADRLARQIEAESGPVTFCVLDMRHVNEIDGTGANILIQLYRNLKKDNKSLLISYVTENHPLWAFLDVIGVVNAIPREHFFKDTDEALEWAEDRLLAGHYPSDECRRYRLEELDALQGFSPEEVQALERRMDRRTFRKGDSVIREGHRDRDLLLLTFGVVSVKLHLPNNDRPRRLFTFGAGAMLGEMALLDGNPRSADVWAETDAELYRLPYEAFSALCRENPVIAAKLLRNIGRVLSHRLRERSEEVRLLEDA